MYEFIKSMKNHERVSQVRRRVFQFIYFCAFLQNSSEMSSTLWEWDQVRWIASCEYSNRPETINYQHPGESLSRDSDLLVLTMPARLCKHLFPDRMEGFALFIPAACFRKLAPLQSDYSNFTIKLLTCKAANVELMLQINSNMKKPLNDVCS